MSPLADGYLALTTTHLYLYHCRAREHQLPLTVLQPGCCVAVNARVALSQKEKGAHMV